jgi:predicted dehydrogenase
MVRAAGAVSGKVRLAVAGSIGADVLYYWHEHPHCEVTAVSHENVKMRRTMARHFRCEDQYASLEEIFDKAEDAFDAVAIFTGAPNHVRHTVMCMEAGKHVCCDAPAALTLEDCTRLRDIKERTGVRFMMAELSYYTDACTFAREAYAAGEFGNLHYSEVDFHLPRFGGKFGVGSRGEDKWTWQYGVPPMLMATRAIGFLIGVTGERITEVSCMGFGKEKYFPAADATDWKNPFPAETALCRTDRGNVSRVNVFWTGLASTARAQWFGDKLALLMRSPGGQPPRKMLGNKAALPWSVPKYSRTGRLPKTMNHGGSKAFVSAEFIDAILAEQEPEIDVYKALAMTVPGIMAHQSALTGGALQKVPSFDRVTS